MAPKTEPATLERERNIVSPDQEVRGKRAATFDERIAAALWGHDAKLYEPSDRVRELFVAAPERDAYLAKARAVIQAVGLDCYLREYETRDYHDLSEGAVCARCYAAAVDCRAVTYTTLSVRGLTFATKQTRQILQPIDRTPRQPGDGWRAS